MTFSIAGVCTQTGMVGCAITSSSICVPSRCAFAKTKVGICLTQNITNPNLGPLGLDLLTRGASVDEALTQVKDSDPYIQWRQLGLLDAQGNSAMFSGTHALGIYTTAKNAHCLGMGNLLANTQVPQAMTDHFAQTSPSSNASHADTLHLAERLLQALEAGIEAGGEMGPVRSAGLLVYGNEDWPIVDLRVDWHDTPITELRHIWHLYQPQMQAYINRATLPEKAESFGVPGDE